MNGENPCNCCKANDKASGCGGCVLDMIAVSGNCGNDKCFLNCECGCMIGLDENCKASTAYKDELWRHDCSECERYTQKTDDDGVEYYTCGESGAQIGKWDDA